MRKIIVVLSLLISIAAWSNQLDNSQTTIIDSLNTIVPINKIMGDSAYMNNDYISAAQAYETLLSNGESAELYYNLGNSYYKMGEIAKAILNYERALLLDPGNDDIRFNLEMAKAKAIDKVEVTPEIFFVSWTKSLINMHGITAWAVCGIVFFILFIVSLYFFIFSKTILLKKIGFFTGILFAVIVICSNIFASQQKKRLTDRDYAIVMTPNVVVRSTPSETGTSLFVLHEGRKVEIKDSSMREWKEIRLEDGKIGWIPTSSIDII